MKSRRHFKRRQKVTSTIQIVDVIEKQISEIYLSKTHQKLVDDGIMTKKHALKRHGKNRYIKSTKMKQIRIIKH